MTASLDEHHAHRIDPTRPARRRVPSTSTGARSLVAAVFGGRPRRRPRVPSPSICAWSSFFASILGHELAHAVVGPPLRRRHDRRSSCGRSAAWPASTASPARPRAEGWIAAAGPLASLAIGVASLGAGASALDRARRCRSDSCAMLVLARPRQRRRSPCSTCCPARRSTAAASCGPCAGRCTATATGPCARPARRAGHRLGASRRSALVLMLTGQPGLWLLGHRACSSPSTPRPRSPTPTSASGSTASTSAS